MKRIRLMITAMLLLLSSGCFYPVFVPVGGGHGGHEHHDRGERRGYYGDRD